MIGAAIATTAVEILGLILGYRAFNKILKVPLMPYMLRPILSSCVMALFLSMGAFWLHLGLGVLLCAGTLIYFLILYLLGGISRGEFAFLKGVFFASPIH